MRWWTQTCSIHCGQSITEQHSPSEAAVLLSLKEAAVSARGTTHWKEILLVKEDPNVTVSKEQRREMRLVVEVSFQHGSQDREKKKKNETSAEGVRCRQLPSEGRKREDRAVWSHCRLGGALISPAGDDTSPSRRKECDRSCGVPVFQRCDALQKLQSPLVMQTSEMSRLLIILRCRPEIVK